MEVNIILNNDLLPLKNHIIDWNCQEQATNLVCCMHTQCMLEITLSYMNISAMRGEFYYQLYDSGINSVVVSRYLGILLPNITTKEPLDNLQTESTLEISRIMEIRNSFSEAKNIVKLFTKFYNKESNADLLDYINLLFTNDMDAMAETVICNKNIHIEISIEFIEEYSQKEVLYVLIHELFHVISFNDRIRFLSEGKVDISITESITGLRYSRRQCTKIQHISQIDWDILHKKLYAKLTPEEENNPTLRTVLTTLARHYPKSNAPYYLLEILSNNKHKPEEITITTQFLYLEALNEACVEFLSRIAFYQNEECYCPDEKLLHNKSNFSYLDNEIITNLVIFYSSIEHSEKPRFIDAVLSTILEGDPQILLKAINEVLRIRYDQKHAFSITDLYETDLRMINQNY